MAARLPVIVALILATTAATAAAAPPTVEPTWPYGSKPQGSKAPAPKPQVKTASPATKAAPQAQPAARPARVAAKPRATPAPSVPKNPPPAAAAGETPAAPPASEAAAEPAPPPAAPIPEVAAAPAPGGELSAQDLDRSSVGMATAEESLEAARTAQVRERTLLDTPGLGAGPAARTPAEQAPVRAADLPNLDLRSLTGPN